MMNQAASIIFSGLLLACSPGTWAQWTFTGQLRTRTEWRDGQGTLKKKDQDASLFTSQRSRMTIVYQASHVTFHTTLQDVRVWGQDASTVSTADGSKLALHEAWAEVTLANRDDTSFSKNAVDYFAIKIGRQEISYDDQRLMGSLDWLQQARRHDAVVLKLINNGWQVDLGGAFNQNTDAVNYNGTFYTPSNTIPYIKDSKGNLAPTPHDYIPLVNAAGYSSPNGVPALQSPASTNDGYAGYKALQYVYAAKTFNRTRISFIALADYFGKYQNDSVMNIAGKDTGYIYGKHFDQRGVNTRITGGIYLISKIDRAGALTLLAGLYYQGGKDRDAGNLAAWTSTISLASAMGAITCTVGWDYLSGNNAFSASSTDHRFDPLYGTPHKFWGNMDYFYVGTGSPAGGLTNPFAKIKYLAAGKRFSAELDYHYFALAKDQKGNDGYAIKKYLGSEVDMVSTYALNKITSLEYGCSVMAASSSMEYAKNIQPGTARRTGLWSYIMITILLNNHQNGKK